jgi:hypothetical protein
MRTSSERTPFVAHNRSEYPAKISRHVMSFNAFRSM